MSKKNPTSHNSILINADQAVHKIDRHIYGQFSEHLGTGIYGGIWVGEDSKIPNKEGYRSDVLDALIELKIPNIRWPGGCFADEYNWLDGVGPRSERPVRINTHWGMAREDNSFGTHEFMRLTELLGAEPYISANVGSGTAENMSRWIEYLTFDGESEMADLRRKHGREAPWKIKFWGIGNESWGCGGNMRPEYYADLYRRFATYAKNYSGNLLYKIASGFSDANYDWTDTVMKISGRFMDALSLHYYTLPTGLWNEKGPSIDFGEKEYFQSMEEALKMDEYVARHKDRMDVYDPEKRVALAVDEWGVWTDPLPGSKPGYLQQQNTMRDALVASMTLDILHRHADRVRIANIAQTVNVLQAMILTEEEKMVLTPTYHVFHMYRPHQDATLLSIKLDSSDYSEGDGSVPSISATASKDGSGAVNLSLSNIHATESQEISCDLRGMDLKKVDSGRLLTADAVDAINSFDQPDRVAPVTFEDYSLKGSRLTIKMPPMSIATLRMQ
ncbi:MAG: alpha-N-arabinofuranosidase [Opitutales bacterium]|nr:alpha-N-arabinofuranosidase [Opitutales bacterium]